MSDFNAITITIYLIWGLISSAVIAAILGIFSAFVLQLLTRLIAGFRLSYLKAYGLSFLSWFIAFIFQSISTVALFRYEVVEKPGFRPDSIEYESLYPPGAVPNSTYIAIISALIAISIIYALRIEHPEKGPIGICKGFSIALINAGLFMLFVMSIVGYIAFIGP